MKNYKIVSDCKLLNLPKIGDERGNLSIIEQLKQIPFEIKRVHWIYDVPGGLDRGSHAYKQTEEFIVALSGSFDVEIDDGENKQVFPLNPQRHVAHHDQFLYQLIGISSLFNGL